MLIVLYRFNFLTSIFEQKQLTACDGLMNFYFCGFDPVVNESVTLFSLVSLILKMPVAISDSTGNAELRLYKDSLSSEFAKELMYSSLRTFITFCA